MLDAPIERPTELVLEQLKHCLESAGSSLDNVLKCNIYCTSVEHSRRSTRSTPAMSRASATHGSSSACRSGQLVLGEVVPWLAERVLELYAVADEP